MKIYHAISIDLARNETSAAVPTIFGVEGDCGTHVLELHLLCGGESWTIPEDVSLLLSYARCDGTGGSYDALPDGRKAWQIVENVLYVELAQACFAIPTLPQKEMQLTVTLLRADQQLTTCRIPLAVQGNLAGGEESDGAYTNFTSLIHQHIGDLSLLESDNAENIVAAVNEALWKCQNSVVSVESLRISEEGELLVTLTDGQVLSAGKIIVASSTVTVCGKEPDEAGNVALTAEDVSALPLSGGTMTGDVSMDGHTVTGLADPVNDTDAVSKSWVENNCSGGKATHVRTNLLDNWHFENPVDQRILGSYESPGYGFDRWYISENVCVFFSGRNLTLTCTAPYADMSQRIENVMQLNGKTVTVSVLVSYNPGDLLISLRHTKNGQTTTLKEISSDETGIISFSYTFEKQSISELDTLSVHIGNGSIEFQEYVLHAVKLEIGDQQTLAYKEGDNWLLYEIPNLADQLLRCQRYFQVFYTESLRPTHALDFRPTMRADPTMSTIGFGSGTRYTASAEL